MGVQHKVAGKCHQYVLAVRRDRFNASAGESMIDVDARQRGQYRFEPRHERTGERAVKGPGRSEDGITLGHI
jgi:hypothetical protein